jgi:hypothetical protein
MMLEAIWISMGTNSLTTEHAEKHGNNQESASPRFLAARHQPTKPRNAIDRVTATQNACGAETRPSGILMAGLGFGVPNLG